MIGFERQRTFSSLLSSKIVQGSLELDSSQAERFNRIKRYWNFYEGYHWEELDQTDGVQLTINYCKAFINKYNSFELGKGFKFNISEKMTNKPVTREGKSSFDYLDSIWKDNGGEGLLNEIGQMKDVTGEAWVHVHFAPPGTFKDPFGIYDDGRIELLLLPTSAVYPDWNPHKRGELLRLVITYQYKKVVVNPLSQRREEKNAVYKQIWTDEVITVRDDGEETKYANKYGTIPFVLLKNLTVAGREEGQSDLEDLIPINTELNMKCSDISEIIDYHAAPITVVTGAKIGNLEKGANKIWGGLPKGSTVQNLSMGTDLGASSHHVEFLKKAMCEVGALPQSALGGAEAISNTSGVALHIAQAPLVDLIRCKKNETEKGLRELNRMILFVSLIEGLITRPEGVNNEDFFFTQVTIPDNMPKDYMIELQMIQQEFNMGLETRQGALERLGRDNIEKRLEAIDKEREAHPDIYGKNSPENQINSGMMNGSTPQEIRRKEMTGENKATNETEMPKENKD